MKILVIEDEAKPGDYLKRGLGEAGFVVDLARNGVDGLHLATSGDYDLVILDVDRKSTRLNSSHIQKSRMPSSA